eukprot:SAG11_NODE_4299_length_1964_cov_1.131367_3_plen_196_part_00
MRRRAGSTNKAARLDLRAPFATHTVPRGAGRSPFARRAVGLATLPKHGAAARLHRADELTKRRRRRRVAADNGRVVECTGGAARNATAQPGGYRATAVAPGTGGRGCAMKRSSMSIDTLAAPGGGKLTEFKTWKPRFTGSHCEAKRPLRMPRSPELSPDLAAATGGQLAAIGNLSSTFSSCGTRREGGIRNLWTR